MRGGVLVYILLTIVAAGCSRQQKDKGVKQMIGTAAREDIAFAGVNYGVANGVVTLSGTCATEQERAKVESKVLQLSGVKQVNNQIMIAPVVLNGGHLLKRAVDSVLMKYPSVDASVEDSVIYLQGSAGAAETEKIITALQTLGAKGITNQLMMSRSQQSHQ